MLSAAEISKKKIVENAEHYRKNVDMQEFSEAFNYASVEIKENIGIEATGVKSVLRIAPMLELCFKQYKGLASGGKEIAEGFLLHFQSSRVSLSPEQVLYSTPSYINEVLFVNNDGTLSITKEPLVRQILSAVRYGVEEFQHFQGVPLTCTTSIVPFDNLFAMLPEITTADLNFLKSLAPQQQGQERQ